MENKVNLSTGQVDQDYVPPAELVPVPSKGKVYPPESTMHSTETVEIRSMTARDEDILTSRALLKSGRAITTLLRSCTVNKSIDPDELLMGDRNAILIAIRITGYGPEYKVDVVCPECGENNKHEFDLSKLPIKPLDVDPTSPGSNSFSFSLPASKKEALFRLATGSDERELSTILERTKKAGGGEAPVTSRLVQQVISIGGETSRDKLANMIRNMPARDSRDLRNYIDKITPGVEMVQSFTCSACNAESEVDVPLGTEFFWPSG